MKAGDREVEAEVVLSNDGREVLRRILEEIPADADPDETGSVRRTACWLSSGGGGEGDRPTGVHIGRYRVGVLAEQDSRWATEVLSRLGGDAKRAGTFAEIRGDDARSAVMTAYFARPLI